MAKQKEEIHQMISSVNDPKLLAVVKDLLSESERDSLIKDRMIAGALKSEEDIKAGRVYGLDDFFRKSKEMIPRK